VLRLWTFSLASYCRLGIAFELSFLFLLLLVTTIYIRSWFGKGKGGKRGKEGVKSKKFLASASFAGEAEKVDTASVIRLKTPATKNVQKSDQIGGRKGGKKEEKREKEGRKSKIFFASLAGGAFWRSLPLGYRSHATGAYIRSSRGGWGAATPVISLWLRHWSRRHLLLLSSTHMMINHASIWLVSMSVVFQVLLPPFLQCKLTNWRPLLKAPWCHFFQFDSRYV
jgi:hypothetical protein